MRYYIYNPATQEYLSPSGMVVREKVEMDQESRLELIMRGVIAERNMNGSTHFNVRDPANPDPNAYPFKAVVEFEVKDIQRMRDENRCLGYKETPEITESFNALFEAVGRADYDRDLVRSLLATHNAMIYDAVDEFMAAPDEEFIHGEPDDAAETTAEDVRAIVEDIYGKDKL